MNDQLTNKNAQESAQSVGEVLSGMIGRLEAGNSAIVGQIREFSQSTTSSLDRVSGAVLGTVPSAESSSGSSVGKEFLNAINPVASGKGTSILTSLFLGPLWKGIFSLFGGGGDEPIATPTKFQFPDAIRTDLTASATQEGRAGNVRTDAFGLTQAVPASQPSINISIQALDARSILDRSDDIAAAVKQAMLSNHEINNNLTEL